MVDKKVFRSKDSCQVAAEHKVTKLNLVILFSGVTAIHQTKVCVNDRRTTSDESSTL